MDREYRILDSADRFKLLGNRMAPVGDGITCDFTASGIEFRGFMVGKVTLSLACDRDTYFTVYVNGERIEDRMLVTPDMTELILAELAVPGEYSIRVLKQTESPWSLAVLYGVSLCGTLYEAPEDRDFYVEFIGDSITGGYGNLGDNASENPGTALWEDGTKTYAFLTAESLGADANIIGCSGITISWDKFSEKDFYFANSYYRDPTAPLTNNSRIPNLIVINLGTNDASSNFLEEDVRKDTRDLVIRIREFYGKDVPIIWVYGMMGSALSEWILPTLEEMGGEAVGLYSVRLPANFDGALCHPTVAAHEKAAALLAEFIKSKNLLPAS
jgi:lysophospholipase L1-like esterase